MSSVGGSGKSVSWEMLEAKEQTGDPLQDAMRAQQAATERKSENAAGLHPILSKMPFDTDQAQVGRPSGAKKEKVPGKTSPMAGLARGAAHAPLLSISVRGQSPSAAGMQTEPSYSNPKKRPATEVITAGSLSAERLSQQGPVAKKPKIESASEEFGEREVLRLRGGAKGNRKKTTANNPSAPAGTSTSIGGASTSTPAASGTGQAPSTQASGPSSQAGRAGTLPAALPASKPSSGMKMSFHPARPASAPATEISAVASGSGAAGASSRTTAQPLPANTTGALNSTQKSAWGLPAPPVAIPAGKPAWGSSTPATVKSPAGSADNAVVKEGAEKIPIAHPKSAEAKKEKINTDSGVRIEGPDQHIARPSVDFNKESNTWGDHIRSHPELLDPAFCKEAQNLAKSECSKESPAWRYPRDVKAENPRETRAKGDALKVGRHSQNGRPMAVVVTGPSTLKTAFYLTYKDQNGKVVDYTDPLTYFNKNAKT